MKSICASLLGASVLAAGAAIPAMPSMAQSSLPNRAPVVAPASTMATLARNVVESNPDIAAQRGQVRIAKARLDGAEAGYLPTIAANGSVQRREIDVKNGGRGDSKYTSATGTVEARVAVYDGNRTYNAVKIAKAELASAEAGLDATVSDTLLELLTSAADVHLNRKILRYSELQSDAIGEQLRATSRRLEFAEATRTDEELARARLATSQAGVLAATEELNVNGNRFRTVSGQSGTIVPPLPELAAIPGSLPEAQRIAAETAPRLRAARLNVQAGKAGVYYASGALLPRLDAVGGYEYVSGGVANLFTGKLPDDRSSFYGGVELNVPIFQPRDYAELRRARAVRDQRLSQTDVASRTVAEEVASSWARWQSAKSTIVTAEAAVAATEQAVEGLKKEAVGGNRTLTEVLDAQNSLLTAQVTLERAHRNEFVARAGLLAAIGRLDAGAILDGRCCATGDAPRPAMSALGHPVIASNAVTGMQIAGGPLRPVQSPLGRPPAPAGIAGTDASRASGNDAVAGYLNPSRPSASLLGRKLD